MRLVIDLEEAEIVGEWPIKANTCTIIATYNQEKYIDQCIESVVNQTISDHHILIHDDFSSDSTLSRARSWQMRYPEKITLIAQKVNQYSQGIPIYSRLLALVESQFCALCEGDDYWTDIDKLKTQIKLLESNNEIGLVFHDVELKNDAGDSQYGEALKKILSRAVEKDYFDFEDIARGNFIMTCSTVLRRASLRYEYLNSIHNLVLEDVIIFSQIAENYKLKFINKKMAVYRIHAKSSWSTALESHRQRSADTTRWFLASRISYPQNLAFQKNLIETLWNSNNLSLANNPIGDYVDLLAQRENIIFNLQSELTKMTNSKSWKLTQIFRSMKKMFRGKLGE